MAKQTSRTPEEQAPDANELLSFQAAWDKNDGDIRKVTTRKGRLRGGLGPKHRALGEEALRKYGL
ncbi:MAG: hypothetical protein V2A79_10105 [Planctomycetota bacterium]